ncbi:oligosaccharide flippase family protein [Georgenia faecalis]|uniref:Oligosaccharide flippase family protein n=1 Tax=Georgenia faecalis TaxID=2483799 RepID=A0ABV9D5V5_9MICO|nr:oligosaccharide flippase family protein [Georgenia faecalis]
MTGAGRHGSRAGGVLVLGGVLGRAAAQWVLVWIFALAGGPEEVGEYSYALAVATPVFLLLQLGLRNVYVTWPSRPPFGRFLGIRVIGSGAAAVVVLALALTPWGPAPALALPVVVLKVADGVLDMVLGRLQDEQAMVRMGGALLTSAALSTAGAAAVVLLHGDVLWALWATVPGPLLTLVVAGLRRSDTRPVPGPWRGEVARIVRTAAPVGVTDVLTSLLTYLPVLVLGLVGSSASVGVFSAALVVVTLVLLVLSAVQTVVLPGVVRAGVDGGRRGVLVAAARLAAGLTAAALMVAAAVVAVGPRALTILYGEAFALPRRDLWPLAVTIAEAPLLMVSGLVLMALGLYRQQMWGAVLAVVAMVVAALVLGADGFGVREAGVVLVVGTAVRVVVALAAAGVDGRRNGGSGPAPRLPA